LCDDEAIYAVSEVCGKGQNAQDCRWRHEYPSMVMEWHGGKVGLAGG
jgi:hypothetical protein